MPLGGFIGCILNHCLPFLPQWMSTPALIVVACFTPFSFFLVLWVCSGIGKAGAWCMHVMTAGCIDDSGIKARSSWFAFLMLNCHCLQPLGVPVRASSETWHFDSVDKAGPHELLIGPAALTVRAICKPTFGCLMSSAVAETSQLLVIHNPGSLPLSQWHIAFVIKACWAVAKSCTLGQVHQL